MSGKEHLPFEMGEFSLRTLGVTINIPDGLGPLLPYVGSFLLASDPPEVRVQMLSRACNPWLRKRFFP